MLIKKIWHSKQDTCIECNIKGWHKSGAPSPEKSEFNQTRAKRDKRVDMSLNDRKKYG